MKRDPNPGIWFLPIEWKGLRLGAWGAGAMAVVLAAAVCAGQYPATVQPSPGYHPEKDTSVTAVNARPDANQLMRMHRSHLEMQRFAAANLERTRQLRADSFLLLQLAAELNQRFQKTGEADMSLSAKADMIEKLARAVQEKMKLTVALR